MCKWHWREELNGWAAVVKKTNKWAFFWFAPLYLSNTEAFPEQEIKSRLLFCICRHHLLEWPVFLFSPYISVISIVIFCQPLHPAQMPLNAHEKIITIIIIIAGMMHLPTTQTKCYEVLLKWSISPTSSFDVPLAICSCFTISNNSWENIVFRYLAAATWLTYISFIPILT